MRYVSLDLETSSLDPARGVILELALVLEDTDKPDVPVDALPHFTAVVAPDDLDAPIIGDVIALSMNARLLYAIAAKCRNKPPGYNVLHRHEAEQDARQWLYKQLPFEAAPRVVAAAKNGAGFDLPWRRVHMPQLARMFIHRVIDPGSVLIDWRKPEPPSMKDLLDGSEPAHSALDDARANIRVLRRAYSNVQT